MTAEECTPDRPCWSPTCDICYDDEGDDDGDGDLAVAARTNEHGPNGQGPKRGEKLDLLDLARDNYRFGVTATRETFAVPLVGPPLVLMVRGDRDTLGPALDRAYFAAKANRRIVPPSPTFSGRSTRGPRITPRRRYTYGPPASATSPPAPACYGSTSAAAAAMQSASPAACGRRARRRPRCYFAARR